MPIFTSRPTGLGKIYTSEVEMFITSLLCKILKFTYTNTCEVEILIKTFLPRDVNHTCNTYNRENQPKDQCRLLAAPLTYFYKGHHP
jgi:hypothetical protein